MQSQIFVENRIMLLFSQIIPSKLGIMKKPNQSRIRPRAEILSDICSVERAVSGKITVRERPLKNGGKARYYQLQQWVGGRNVTTHIPASKIGRYEDAVAGHARISALTGELSDADAQELGADGTADAKKKLSRKPAGSRASSAKSR